MLFALHDVTKTYGKITALRQLSVSVPPGAVGLLGPNGAGKNTGGAFSEEVVAAVPTAG